MRTKLLLILVVSSLLLAACGQKGELVRPKPQPESSAQP